MQEELSEIKSDRIALLAPTGSGKTVAFLLWMASRLKKSDGNIRALIIVPTRELAQQISEVFRKLIPDYRTATFYGGRPLRDEQNRLLSGSLDILIATPGRLLDHIQRKTVDLSKVTTLIIDEMDKCLDLGFLPDIKRILKTLKHPKYFLMASATMPSDPELIKITGELTVLDFTGEGGEKKPDIEIVEIPSASKDKLQTLVSLLDSLPNSEKTIIFTNHRESAERVYTNLKKEGFPVSLYHGGLEQQDRELALIALKNDSSPILVSTDLGARGLDIPEVENIIHYHLPTSQDAYIHRNGRTARAGASGTAYVIVNEEENIPEYLKTDRKWIPGETRNPEERKSDKAMIVFNIGKKDKISRGDILGFLTKQVGLAGEEIGKIDIGEHFASAAVPVAKVRDIQQSSEGVRLKNKRFRLAILN